jgi:hypothetical protein
VHTPPADKQESTGFSLYLNRRLGNYMQKTIRTLSPCGTGETVVGYLYGWNVTHYVEGNYGNLFAAQDTSINSPFNTISTSFSISH